MALLYIFRFRYNYLRARIMSAVQLQEASPCQLSTPLIVELVQVKERVSYT